MGGLESRLESGVGASARDGREGDGAMERRRAVRAPEIHLDREKLRTREAIENLLPIWRPISNSLERV